MKESADDNLILLLNEILLRQISIIRICFRRIFICDHFCNLVSFSKFNFCAESTSSACRYARLLAVKNESISKSILIANAIPAVGIPNWVNKIV